LIVDDVLGVTGNLDDILGVIHMQLRGRLRRRT